MWTLALAPCWALAWCHGPTAFATGLHARRSSLNFFFADFTRVSNFFKSLTAFTRLEPRWRFCSTRTPAFSARKSPARATDLETEISRLDRSNLISPLRRQSLELPKLRPTIKDEPRPRRARLVPRIGFRSAASFRSCFGSTRRDRRGRWLWRLVGLLLPNYRTHLLAS
jgi:hypothetical protein